MSGIKRQERIKANKEKRRLKREQVAQERAWARDACCALGRRARFCRSAGQTPKRTNNQGPKQINWQDQGQGQ